MLAAQMQDEQLSRIRTILTSGKRTSEVKHYFDDHVIKRDKLYRKLCDERTIWVVPRHAQIQICRLCHDDAGHLGVKKSQPLTESNHGFRYRTNETVVLMVFQRIDGDSSVRYDAFNKCELQSTMAIAKNRTFLELQCYVQKDYDTSSTIQPGAGQCSETLCRTGCKGLSEQRY